MDNNEILDSLITRYPKLIVCRDDILMAFQTLKTTFLNGNKLLIAGNGGSAADCEHIAGELLKSFRIKRQTVNSEVADKLADRYGEDGTALAAKLECALPAIPLPSITSLNTAFANDVDPYVAFAQLVYALGSEGDALLAISTSGNAQNVVNAVMAANATNIRTIGLTSFSGGKLVKLCDITICAPSTETYAVQEYHMPIYHALCAMLEEEFFSA